MASPAFFRDRGLDEIPSTGPLSVSVPGAVAAWVDIHERFGSLPFAGLLGTAIGYARESGIPYSEAVVRNRYVAIGDMHGGYFFLPPWDLWAEWAKRGVSENRQRPEIGSDLEIWINAYPRDRKTKLPA